MEATHRETIRVPGRRLGVRKRTTRPVISFSAIRRRTDTGAYVVPTARQNLARFTQWDVRGNDEYGDCGPVSVVNSYALTTAALTGTPIYPTLDATLDLYRRSGNPNFPQDDNGVDMQVMLDE